MFLKSFKGGVRLKENKLSSSYKPSKASLPSELVIYSKQHIGKPSKPVVKKGDFVKKYQLLFEMDGMGSNIHAPTSGTIIAIEKIPAATSDELAVILKPDNKDLAIDLKERDGFKLGKTELLKIIEEKGIVGMGGAQFPTHIKLNINKPIDYLLINGAECEPYITADHQLMLENTYELIRDIKLLLKLTSAREAVIGVEENKDDAIVSLKNNIAQNDKIRIVKLKAKYPQGAEKNLIYALTGRKVPPGKLPIDAGVVVQNVSTVKAIYDAVFFDKPLVERIVTVSGLVNKPCNIIAPIGMKIRDLIKAADGYSQDPDKLILGGPMMGFALSSDEIAITKGSNAVLAFENYYVDEEPCIRCGKCTEVCPMGLMPTMIMKNVKHKRYNVAAQYNIMDCYECGSCAYSCPANIPLVQYIRLGKQKIRENRN